MPAPEKISDLIQFQVWYFFMLEWGVVPIFFVILDFVAVWCCDGTAIRAEIGDVYRSWNGNRLDNQYY